MRLQEVLVEGHGGGLVKLVCEAFGPQRRSLEEFVANYVNKLTLRAFLVWKPRLGTIRRVGVAKSFSITED